MTLMALETVVRKPGLLAPSLFVPCITTLVFAALVFTVFLSASYSLNYGGYTPDTLSINFVLLGFSELTLVLSGTLLCAILVFRVGFNLILKPKSQLQELL